MEVGLILAIITSYLKKLGRRELINYVYYGAGFGIMSSIVLAVSLPVIYSPEVAVTIAGPASAQHFSRRS